MKTRSECPRKPLFLLHNFCCSDGSDDVGDDDDCCLPDGNACWSFLSPSVLVPAADKATGNSAWFSATLTSQLADSRPEQVDDDSDSETTNDSSGSNKCFILL